MNFIPFIAEIVGYCAVAYVVLLGTFKCTHYALILHRDRIERE